VPVHDRRERFSALALRATDFKPAPEAPFHIFVYASDSSENRFALFGPVL
jgi:hypothetical protein